MITERSLPVVRRRSMGRGRLHGNLGNGSDNAAGGKCFAKEQTSTRCMGSMQMATFACVRFLGRRHTERSVFDVQVAGAFTSAGLVTREVGNRRVQRIDASFVVVRRYGA